MELDVEQVEFEVVDDEYGQCPECGAYWGHEDEDLNYPNREKVDRYWKCYNPDCKVGYYHPETGDIEYTWYETWHDDFDFAVAGHQSKTDAEDTTAEQAKAVLAKLAEAQELADEMGLDIKEIR